MATFTHNPIFKVPAGPAPRYYRSPSPPHAFVEPLSPAKPRALEPQYNYPALDPTLQFSVHAEQAFSTQTRPGSYSRSYKSGHKRKPSSIDTLAEAAFAVSPSYLSNSGHGSTTYHHATLPQTQAIHGDYGVSEPPHKRRRSEYLPAPQVGVTASRPATSYETNNGWSHHHAYQVSNGYDSRVEEAALLLNFRTGGMSPPNLPVNHRPHANSFPRDSYLTRPPVTGATSALLPAFAPQLAQHETSGLPSPQQTIDDARLSPDIPQDTQLSEDVKTSDALITAAETSETKPSHEPQQTQTPPDEDRAPTESENGTSKKPTEAARPRRGWPKGKPRGPSGKKSTAEKPAARRPGPRKKPDTVKKAKASKVHGVSSAETPTRRKSLSDIREPEAVSWKDELSSLRCHSVPRDVPMSIKEITPPTAAKRQAKVKPDTVCAGCSTSRESVQANSELDEWISCNGCKKWFHIDCAGFQKIHQVRDVDKYFCSSCEPVHGRTTFVRKSNRAHTSVDYAELQRGVLKTSEDSVEHHYIQPIKDGTFHFEPESYPRMRPEMVTREFLEKSNTFVEPICIPAEWNPRPWNERAGFGFDPSSSAKNDSDPDKSMADLLPHDFEYDTIQDDGQDRLEMVMPEGLTVRHVCGLVGADTPLDVIDVKTQNSGSKWTLARWADYYEQQGGEKAIRNVISLEVSQTKLGRLLRRPKVVRDIDLQDDVWPREEMDKGKWPKVQFYCLMSVADSYTDFHIDFGGSSVYYHILKGKKTFFFIPPKAKNLKAYEEWNNNPQQNFTFLPHITKECFRVDLSEGDTMLIPSGWIHAVWTPEDSLVIGGNFLTRMSYKNQFRVVDIEKANHTPMKFRYPYFQKIMWYTAIKYLKTDPLPQEVSQLFYDGKKFERQVPLWSDFDGAVAADEDRPGAANTRYYSQAELDGLPELVSFLYRTVMLVMGRIEGTSADQQKRVNASIPKGHGEPLEVAKTFALWVAWKRGNEDPPAWAHPDAELQLHKDEGASKKLSARALKGLERKEAIAAWRIAPDRQSERVMSKQAATVNPVATPSVSTATPPVHAPPPPSQQTESLSQPPQLHQSPSIEYSNASPTTSPTATMMNMMPGHHMSTPKTSVLGPKRVACDTCRKRRIRCKHKDMVMQLPAASPQQLNGSYHDFQTPYGSDLHDNITVTPAKGQMPYMNGHTPQPGTNAYVTANIPMTLNGVPAFGDLSKRGRSKACFECRKSKRRCVHDESGNVDPLKAAETPVPRGSNSSKKRPAGDEQSPSQPIKKQKSATPVPLPPMQIHAPTPPAALPSGQSNGPLPQIQVRPPSSHDPPVFHAQQSQTQPPIDPTLQFFTYPEPAEQPMFESSHHPYPVAEQQPQFDFQSLEQIANEVLDMNGRSHEEPYDAKRENNNEHVHVYNVDEAPDQSNGLLKSYESPDSGVSMPRMEHIERQATSQIASDAHDTSISASTNGETKPDNTDTIFFHGLPPVQHSIEPPPATNGITTSSAEVARPPSSSKTDVSGLPLYQPPAPPSQSPEMMKRQPLLPNGTTNTINGASQKRKRDSASGTPRPTVSAKNAKAGLEEDHHDGAVAEETDDERMARLLQQEELGLRRRG